MLPRVLVALCALLTFSQQAPSEHACVCELSNSEHVFPHEQLRSVEDNASKCSSETTYQKNTLELEGLLLGLDRRLPALQEDVSTLETEDDGELYGVLSLQIIENELKDIQQLMDKLNRSITGDLQITAATGKQLEEMKAEMKELQRFDAMQVVRTQEANRRLKRDLSECRTGLQPTVPPTQPQPGVCPHGQFVNVTGPRVNTAGEYPGSYKYGAWGRDPRPEAGREKWYWLVPLTSSNRFSNYVRQYSSLSSLIVGVSVPGNTQIHPSNPTTNTIQGPNVVLFAGALFYNCYNRDAVCRFDLTAKTVTTVQLPKGTRFNSKGNFCHPEECFPFTDLDLATDESGVWVTFATTQDSGYLLLAKVEFNGSLTLGQTWRTSVYKMGVTNTFVACGVLYATRYVDKDTEEIFYALDTATGLEKFNMGVFIRKMSPNIYALNYSPVDQMLHAYCDSVMVSYKVEFQ